MPRGEAADSAGRCPYCGRPVRGDAVYCKLCLKHGYHYLYETLGRTNGWDVPKRPRRSLRFALA